MGWCLVMYGDGSSASLCEEEEPSLCEHMVPLSLPEFCRKLIDLYV